MGIVRNKRSIALSGTIMLCLISLGCTRSIVVPDKFPQPVMQKLPFSVSLYLDNSLRNFKHSEEVDNGPDWNVDFGQSNAALFQQVVQGMFEQVVTVSDFKSGSSIDALLKPEMVEYQLSTPAQSKSDYSEAWIKYRIKVYSPQGDLVETWQFTAYGRNENQLFGSEAAMQEATRRAMRDAAAAMVVDFIRQPRIRQLFYTSKKRGDKADQPLETASES